MVQITKSVHPPMSCQKIINDSNMRERMKPNEPSIFSNPVMLPVDVESRSSAKRLM